MNFDANEMVFKDWNQHQMFLEKWSMFCGKLKLHIDSNF
jgi:hypothetical protein